MTKTILLAALATVLLSGATVNRAHAVVSGPATVSDEFTGDQNVLQARWVCSETRCDWQPWNVFAPAHPWASHWRAPPSPGCYYEKRRRGWRQICPR